VPRTSGGPTCLPSPGWAWRSSGRGSQSVGPGDGEQGLCLASGSLDSVVDLRGGGRRLAATQCDGAGGGGSCCLSDESCIDERQYRDQEAEVLHAT
jgi:hypothetical protein